MIYFDNAATTVKKPEEVRQAVYRAMETMGNSGRAAHDFALDASRTIYRARESLRTLLDAPRADHVVFTSNATEALNTAIQGLFQPGDHVISTVTEHNSVLRPLYEMEQRGTEITLIKTDGNGVLLLEEMEKAIRNNTRGIVVNFASNLTGNVNPVREIARLAKEYGLVLVVDAAQAAGSLPFSMSEWGIDVLCFTGHKSLMGPQGTGGLCVRPGLDIRPLKSGGTGVQSYRTSQPEEYPNHLEAGTLNGHGIAGLGAAADFISSVGVAAIHEKEMHLLKTFVEGVREIPGLWMVGDFSAFDRAPICSLNLKDLSSDLLENLLWERYEIAVRSGAHCAPRLHEALGTKAQGLVRFSFGWYNTEEEIHAAIAALWEIAEWKKRTM